MSAVDPVVASNARQSEFYARADREGTNDRGDVTSGDGYSRYDYDEVEDTGCTFGHWGSRIMACDRDGATQRDGFWLCAAHAADHDALVREAHADAERERESNGSVTTT